MRIWLCGSNVWFLEKASVSNFLKLLFYSIKYFPIFLPLLSLYEVRSFKYGCPIHSDVVLFELENLLFFVRENLYFSSFYCCVSPPTMVKRDCLIYLFLDASELLVCLEIAILAAAFLNTIPLLPFFTPLCFLLFEKFPKCS